MTTSPRLIRRPIIRPPMRLDECRRAAFGQIIRQHREQCGFDEAILARLTGLNPETVVEIEEHGELPTIDVAFALADALGTDAAELFHETRRRAEDLAAAAWLSTRAAIRWEPCPGLPSAPEPPH